MKIEHLTLYNFRNLGATELVPADGLNLIVGPNAAGKSNLCEALYYAAKGWLLKGERQRDVIAWGAHEAALELTVNGDHVRIHLNGQARAKTIELNREKKTQSEVSALVRVVLFTPDELQIIKGRPEERRRFLDRSIAELSREYRYIVLEYEQTLQRKNALLRQGKPNLDVLEVFNEELIARGSRIIAKRIEYLKAINRTLSQRYRAISGRASELTVTYETPLDLASGDVRAQIAQLIAQAAPEEIRRGVALVGPHRDDVRFDLDGHDLRRFGSQGEQKSALCAMLLAQLDLYYQRFGDYPVLLLDDILSELDSRRFQRLLQLLPPGVQIFLAHTVTEMGELHPAVRTAAQRIFMIEDGKVSVVL